MEEYLNNVDIEVDDDKDLDNLMDVIFGIPGDLNDDQVAMDVDLPPQNSSFDSSSSRSNEMENSGIINTPTGKVVNTYNNAVKNFPAAFFTNRNKLLIHMKA